MTEEQLQREAEELYPRVNINDCSSDLQYHHFVGLVEASRTSYIKARRLSEAELSKLREELEALKKENEAAEKYIKANADIIFILENATIDSKYVMDLQNKTQIAAIAFDEYTAAKH